MSAATWLVCEQGDRWWRALNFFAGRGAASEPPFAFRTATASQISALSHQQPSLIILWEIPSSDPREVIEAIARCQRALAPPLQLVTYTRQLSMSPAEATRLHIALRQLGAALVLRHPEQIPLAMRFARRYLKSERLRR